MKLERVKRWQWLVVSVVLGLALAWARRPDQHALLTGAGRVVTDQGWFEREVLREVPLPDGRAARAFQQVRVTPAWIDEGEGGRRRRVDLVTGMYLAETHFDPATGAMTGRLRRYTYVAPVPYRPLNAPADARGTAGTVTDFLDGLGGEVAYTRALDPRHAALLWVGGTVVVVGLAWPTLINLLAYGSWRRPPEEKGVRLGPAAHAAPARDPSRDLTDEELQRLAAFEAAVAAGLSVGPGDTDPVAGAAPDVVALPAEPLTAVQPAPCPGAKDFGATPEDFYPTELKAKPAGKTDARSDAGGGTPASPHRR